MGRNSRAVLARWGIALTSIFFGWLTGFLLYLAIAYGSPRDQIVWAIWTGCFCVVAWLLIGVPLAVLDPDLSSAWRSAVAVLATGCIGVAMLVLFFREFALNPIFLLAFLTAATSMLIYTVLLRAFFR